MDQTKNDKESFPQEKIADFQRYIINLSSVFLATPITDIKREIDSRLQEVARFWDFSQIFLMRFTDERRKLVTVNAYTAHECVPAPPGPEVSRVPWLLEVLNSRQPKAMANVLDEIPDEAVSDREEVIRLGIKSALILPFVVGGEVHGGLFFNSITKYRKYHPQLIMELRHLGQILAGALERLSAYEKAQHSMRFDRILSEMSATYINLPANEIISSIIKDLGRLGLFLQVDRCIFYLAGDKNGTYRIDDLFNWWAEEDHAQVDTTRKWIKEHPEYIDSYQYCFDKWNRGEVVQYSKLEELPPEAGRLRCTHEIFGHISWLSVPVSMSGSIVGALVVATTKKARLWSDQLVPRLRLFGEIFANAIRRKEQDESLKKAFCEIKDLKKQIEADYVYLRDELTLEHNYEDIIGQSEGLKGVLFKVEQVGPTDVSVLIIGETGTGKELIARAIHNTSSRSARPLIKVNCAALAPNLIESELFGHEKGAFTGADKRRIGRFELANGATLFLDEIGELPLNLQPKLLRVLQEGEFERLGGSQTIKVDVRIIAATNRNLEQMVESGRFRSDLWYRLNSFPIFLPPLRQRQEDIPLFVQHFVHQHCSTVGKHFDKIPRKVIEQIRGYSWPGNVRELDNVISRAVITSDEGNLQVQIPESPERRSFEQKTLREMEGGFIMQTLEDSGWTIEGPKGAAQKLDLKPSTLRNKMKRLGIVRPAV